MSILNRAEKSLKLRINLTLSATSRNPRLKLLKILNYSDLSPMASFEKFGWNKALFAQIKLPTKPLILNIGGFKGDSTQFLQDLYGGQIYVVEPIPQYISSLEKRFSNNKNVSDLLLLSQMPLAK